MTDETGGTAAMYRARLRDAERARDELAADVDRLTRERDEARAALRDLRDAVQMWRDTPPCDDHGPWEHEHGCGACRREVIVADDLCGALADADEAERGSR